MEFLGFVLTRVIIGFSIENGKCEKKGHLYEGMDWTDIVKDSVK